MLKVLIFSLFLGGCAAAPKQITVIYDIKDESIYDLKGIKCLQSGLMIDEQREVLTTFFSNCPVTHRRHIEEREKSQW